MKALFLIFIACLLLLAPCSHTQKSATEAIRQIGTSWEGELNPTEFGKWEAVKVLYGGNLYVWIIARNPDEFSPIRFVVLIYKRDGTLVEYRYFRRGEPHVFEYNAEADKYWQKQLPAWKRQQCLDCHRPKAELEKI